jgi:peptide-methionine (S)-S-oxide reductase
MNLGIPAFVAGLLDDPGPGILPFSRSRTPSMRRSPALLLALIGGLSLPPLIGMALTASPLRSTAAERPAPSATVPRRDGGTQTAVLAGGCFWGVEAVFERVRGVSEVVSGYAGGTAATADYQQVSSGTTDHAEAVQITYDPGVISYDKLLDIYFAVAHNPTELNRQGPDVGKQYRSAVFFVDSSQKRAALASIAQWNKARLYGRPIVTQVVPLQSFYPAESYHQNYIAANPGNPYVVVHDLPKLAQLRIRFSELLK